MLMITQWLYEYAYTPKKMLKANPISTTDAKGQSSLRLPTTTH